MIEKYEFDNQNKFKILNAKWFPMLFLQRKIFYYIFLLITHIALFIMLIHFNKQNKQYSTFYPSAGHILAKIMIKLIQQQIFSFSFN